MLQYASRNWFWKNGEVFVNMLASEINLQKGISLWETLERLIRHALDPGDEELFQIMFMRFVDP
jgi:hypothetical protein